MSGTEARIRESRPLPSCQHHEEHQLSSAVRIEVTYLKRMNGDEYMLNPGGRSDWVYIVSSYEFLVVESISLG